MNNGPTITRRRPGVETEFWEAGEREALLVLLKMLEVATVRADYDGENGRSETHRIVYYDNTGSKMYGIGDTPFEYAAKEGRRTPDLDSVLEDILYRAIDDNGHDSGFDDAGSEGRLEFDLTTDPPNIWLKHKERVIELESYEHEL